MSVMSVKAQRARGRSMTRRYERIARREADRRGLRGYEVGLVRSDHDCRFGRVCVGVAYRPGVRGSTVRLFTAFAPRFS